ncbi:MAG TPA: hypothetical protein VFL14_15420 [Xanthomonadales bacterium]|nr:hypothetical protein [Xanthomonadales bacterium]
MRSIAVFLCFLALSATPAEAATHRMVLPVVTGPGQAYDGFGTALARDGEWLVVGAPGDRVRAQGWTSTGAVHVYRRVGSVWQPTQRLRPDAASVAAGAAGEYAGSVAISGTWLAVGAPDGNGTGGRTGRVFLYQLDGGTWVQAGVITPPGTGSLRGFGRSLSLDGTVLAVGRDPSPLVPTERVVDLYDRFGNTWSHDQAVTTTNATPFDRVVPHVSGGNLAFDVYGRVELWRRSSASGDWQPLDIVQGDFGSPGFGASIALQGDRLVVGEPNTSGTGDAVYVFERNGADWLRIARLTTANGEPFATMLGANVALSGNDVYALGDGFDDQLGQFIARFRNVGGSWEELPRIDAPDARDVAAAFGATLAAGVDGVVVAAADSYTEAGEGAGRVHAYAANGVRTQQLDLGAAPTRAGVVHVDGDLAAWRLPYQQAQGRDTGRLVDLLARVGSQWQRLRTMVLPREYDRSDASALCGRQVLLRVFAEGRQHALHAFDVDGSASAPLATIAGPPAPQGGEFARLFACSGPNLVVTDEIADATGLPQYLRFYRWTGAAWNLVYTLPNVYAQSLDVSGDGVVVGASDGARTLRFDGATWTPDPSLACAECGTLDGVVGRRGARVLAQGDFDISTFALNGGAWVREAGFTPPFYPALAVAYAGDRAVAWNAEYFPATLLPAREYLFDGNAWSSPRQLDWRGVPLRVQSLAYRDADFVVSATIDVDPRTDNPDAPALFVDDPDVLLEDGFE